MTWFAQRLLRRPAITTIAATIDTSFGSHNSDYGTSEMSPKVSGASTK